jgi:hypothetical protein
MASNYNFFAPFFQILLIPPGGKEVPLWQGPVPQAATDAGLVAVGKVNTTNLAVVTEFSIELSMGAAFVMKLTLNPSYEDGLALLSSDMIQNGQTWVKARFGYVGTGQVLSDWFVGQVTNPGFTIGTEIQITLEAHVTQAARAVTQSATRQWADKTRKQIVEDLAKGSGATDMILRIEWPAALKPLEKSLLEDLKISMEQGGKSDLAMIGHVLDQAILDWSIRTDQSALEKAGAVLQIKDRDSLFGGPTKRVFRLFGPPVASKTSKHLAAGIYGGISGGGGGIFPIVTVSTSTPLLSFPGATRGAVRPAFDEAKKKEVPPVVKDTNVDAPSAVVGPAKGGKSAKGPATGSDSYAAPDLAKGGGAGLKVGDSGSPIQEAKNTAALVKEAVAGIRLSVETVGIPDFLPPEVVEIQGLGVKMDGTYSVDKVTHTLGSGGFVTKFECMSNGAYLDTATAPSPSPTNAPTEPESGAVVTPTPESP